MSTDWTRGRSQASIAFVSKALHRLETAENAHIKRQLELAIAQVRDEGMELRQSLTPEAYMYVGLIPPGEGTFAQCTGKAWLSDGPATDITVRLSDSANGAEMPVRLEWPLVVLHFTCFLQVRLEFMTFGRYSGVQEGVRNLVEQCLNELNVPHIKPY